MCKQWLWHRWTIAHSWLPDLGFCCLGKMVWFLFVGKRFLIECKGCSSRFAAPILFGRCAAIEIRRKDDVLNNQDAVQMPYRIGRCFHRQLISRKSPGTSHLWINLWTGHRQFGSSECQRDGYRQRRREGYVCPGYHQLNWRVLRRAPDSARL